MSKFKETEVGIIPSDWDVGVFAKDLKVQGRIGWKGYKTSDLVATGPYVIGGAEIKSKIFLDLEKAQCLRREKYDESPEIMLKDGDVLLVTRGNLGEVGYYHSMYGEGTINPSVIILNSFNGDSKFLYYYLTSRHGNANIMSLAGGSSVPAIYQADVKELKYPRPRLKEQKLISEVAFSIDLKIDLLQRQNKTLEALAETLFRQWFLEEVDASWGEQQLSDIAEHLKKSTNPSMLPETIFKHYSIPAFDEGREPKDELGKDILSNKYEVVSNTILISKLNPKTSRVWALLKVDEKSICSTEFQVVKPIRHEWFGFVYCFLKSYRVTQELSGAVGGTSGSHQRVIPDDIFNLAFNKPPQKIVERFNAVTEVGWVKIKANKKQIRTLTKLRDTLLPKLMSGEVRVKL